MVCDVAAPVLSTPQEKHSLATAFQATPLQFPPAPVSHPAAFAWLQPLQSLVAVGGSSPNVLHR